MASQFLNCAGVFRMEFGVHNCDYVVGNFLCDYASQGENPMGEGTCDVGHCQLMGNEPREGMKF